MNFRRPRFSAWCALLAVVFAQLATAAYACPSIEAALNSPGMAIPCADMAMEGPSEPSGLCLEHCKAGQQLVETHSPVDLPQAAQIFFFVATLLADDVSVRQVPADPLLARAAAPLVFASSARRRI